MATALGVDLACRSWRDVGFGRVSFDAADLPSWTEATPDCIPRPGEALTAARLASLIDRYAIDEGVGAVALDGPQGWREPNPPQRKGVGRCCEYETRTQGKTGTFGRTYPQTQHRWIAFCVEVFDELLSLGHAALANNANPDSIVSLGPKRYHLLEVFPTSIWRSLGLAPLPGHSKAPPEVVKKHAHVLQARLRLPPTAVTDRHDDLQGLVSALAGAALLGGPCRPRARGTPAFVVEASSERPAHRAEGLIWEACSSNPLPGNVSSEPDSAASPIEDEANDRENPLLPDERDRTTDEVLRRGVDLFQTMVARANAGEAVGISYAAFAVRLFAVTSFAEIVGRDYVPSDSGFVIRLAMAVTDAAGGRKTVTRAGNAIQAGMDTFIWSSKAADRSPKAWSSRWGVPPYTREEWLRVFPDGARRIL
jgi:hypothetical protein